MKFINSFLQTLISFLQKRIDIKSRDLNQLVDTLAPRILTEEKDLHRIRPYLTSLKNAIEAEEINNIAVTGNYGSGKSAILKTFQHQNPQYKYLNISLASFKDNVEDQESFERRLEISILQQMFYHVKPSIIPDSRFKRIVNITNRKLFFLTTFFIAWVLSILFLFKFGYIEKLNPIKWNLKYSFDWITFLFSTLFFLGIALFAKTVYRLLRNSKINKLNIKGELGLGEAVDKSIFNQHLEEILYFFERTVFNVVIIEDVDRFNSTDIFTKLREINILINKSDLIKRQIKFVYAIKDEMFTDKSERVKFFEFIIPIIPFINPSNANDQLAKLISNSNLQGVLSPDFTSDVVTFIDDIDMRLLINIFQEYQIYRNIVSPPKQDNLFAILVYKNMYPDDFGDLAKRRGKLYNFLISKPIYIKQLKLEITTQIQKIDDQITLLEKEVDKSIEELRAVYIYKLVGKLSNFHSFNLNGRITVLDAVKNEYFNKIKSASDIDYYWFSHSYSDTYHLNSGSSSRIKFSSIEKEISNELTYDQREVILREKSNNQTKIFFGSDA